MEDKIQPFRQPLVTATGIILGFILNFASSFVKSDNYMDDVFEYVCAISILTGILLLILVLARMLKMNYPREKYDKYYNRTLLYFILGISLSFVGVMIDMFSNFMAE